MTNGLQVCSYACCQYSGFGLHGLAGTANEATNGKSAHGTFAEKRGAGKANL
jgi:hypothetical protein